MARTLSRLGRVDLVLDQVDRLPQEAVISDRCLAGLGGGMVTAPNLTLSLQNVPVPMVGAAGGALQTAQRIGGAIGTAPLATVFYQLTRTGHAYPVAVSDALWVRVWTDAACPAAGYHRTDPTTTPLGRVVTRASIRTTDASPLILARADRQAPKRWYEPGPARTERTRLAASPMSARRNPLGLAGPSHTAARVVPIVRSWPRSAR